MPSTPIPDNTTDDLTEALQTIAVTKAVKTAAAKNARNHLAPGEYDVDVTVRVSGTVRVGEDYQKTVPNKAKPWDLLVAALTEINRLRSAAGQTGIDLDKLVAAAEAVDSDAVKKAKARAQEAAAALKEATLVTAKGPVTTKLDVVRLDATPLC